MTMDHSEVYSAAAVLAAGAIRDVGLKAILERYPDPVDARAIQEAMLTADAHLEWSMSWSRRKAHTVRVVAVLGSPILVPVLAVLHIAWGFDKLIRAWVSGYREGRRG